MIIYEVNLKVKPEIATYFKIWLNNHINQMLDIDGFKKADWYELYESNEDKEKFYCIQYHVQDKKSLNSYFKNQAEDMREDGIRHFGDQFSAKRRILIEVKDYNSK